MSQILDPLPNGANNSVLCCYVNQSDRIQVARITNIPNWYFERVVFPQQRLVFEAVPQALLEIHCGMMASAILSDTIPCERLCVNDLESLKKNASVGDKSHADEAKNSLDNPVEAESTKSTVSV